MVYRPWRAVLVIHELFLSPCNIDSDIVVNKTQHERRLRSAVKRGSHGRKVLFVLLAWPHRADGVLLAVANLGASSCCSQLGMLPVIDVRLARTFSNLGV
jgi:hypothetical protein